MKQIVSLVTKELEEILAPFANTASFGSIIKEHITEHGKGYVRIEGEGKPWALLPALVSDAICGVPGKAVSAAVAIHLLMSAGDLFDDIEDGDTSDTIVAQYGIPIATNIATTLVFLAEHSLTNNRFYKTDAPSLVNAIEHVNSAFTRVCLGQHLDLSLSLENTCSETDYLTIVKMKSAEQIRCACHLGAVLSTDHPTVIELFDNFGINLGMVAQISNDILGITTCRDLLRRAITLPIVFAFHHASEIHKRMLSSAFGANNSELNTLLIKRILFECGAMHYSELLVEKYKCIADEALIKLAQMGVSTNRLKLFIG